MQLSHIKGDMSLKQMIVYNTHTINSDVITFVFWTEFTEVWILSTVSPPSWLKCQDGVKTRSHFCQVVGQFLKQIEII